MALLPTNLDYTDKDFDALRARLFNAILSVFPEWTDHEASNFGNILVECFAFVGDVLTYYQDNQAGESRLVTATQRANAIALVKLIGFTVPGAQAAHVDVTLSIPAAVAGDVVLAKETIVRTEAVVEPVVFRLDADYTIPAGSTSVAATAVNSDPDEDVFSSDGTPNQEFVLGSTPFLDGSSVITAADGTYTVVDDLLSSTSADKHCTITVDQNDRATIRFGNGTNGKIPLGSITVDYRTGGGDGGQVEAGAVRVIEGSFTDSFGTPVQPAVTNASPSEGGEPRMSLSQVKVQAPASLRVLERAVAREDFEIAAVTVAGVARAFMATSNEDAGVPENTGILYVVPDVGGAPDSTTKDAVAALFARGGAYRSTLTFNVLVQDPEYLDFNITAHVYRAAGYTTVTTGAALRAALEEWFAITTTNADGEVVANPNVDFGYNYKDQAGDPANEIALSDVFNVVRDTAGVRKIGVSQSDFLINGAHADVTIAARQFPRLGTVTLIDGTTGEYL